MPRTIHRVAFRFLTERASLPSMRILFPVWAGLEDDFMNDGKINNSFVKKASDIDPLESAWGEVLATKTHGEKEDEGAERLVRPAPKNKPPRYDLHQEKVREPDSDMDTKDDDLSLNYKKVAYHREAINKRQQKKNDKKNAPPAPPKPKAPPSPPKPKGLPPLPVGAPKPGESGKKEEPEHKPGEVWETDEGYAAKNPDGVSKGGFEDKGRAEAYAKGKPLDEVPTGGENARKPHVYIETDALADAMDDVNTEKMDQASKALKTDYPELAGDVDAFMKEYWSANADYDKAVEASNRAWKGQDIKDAEEVVAKADKARKDVADKIRGLTQASKPKEAPKPDDEPATPTKDEDKALEKKWNKGAPEPEPKPEAPPKQHPAQVAADDVVSALIEHGLGDFTKVQAALDKLGQQSPDMKFIADNLTSYLEQNRMNHKTKESWGQFVKAIQPQLKEMVDAEVGKSEQEAHNTEEPVPPEEQPHNTEEPVPPEEQPAKDEPVAPKAPKTETNPVQYLQDLSDALSDVTKVDEASVLSLQDALQNAVMDNDDLQDQADALDRTFVNITKAIKQYKSLPDGGDKDRAEVAFSQAAKGLKRIQKAVAKSVKTKQDEEIAKRPLLIGGVAVSDESKSVDQLIERGKAAMKQYTDADPATQKKMISQLKHGLQKAKNGTDRHKELAQIAEGMNLASIAKDGTQLEVGDGDDRGLLTEQKSSQYLALGKALGRMGNAGMLLDVMSDDPNAFYGPKGREAINAAMSHEDFSDDDLVQVFGGSAGLANVLRDPTTPNDTKDVIRRHLKGMIIDNMTTCHAALLNSYCGPDKSSAVRKLKDDAKSGDAANVMYKDAPMPHEEVKRILGKVHDEDQASVRRYMQGQFSLGYPEHYDRIMTEVQKLIDADPEACSNLETCTSGLSSEDAEAALKRARQLHQKYLDEIMEQPEFQRSASQKMQEFLAHAEPETRERMKGKSPEEFMEIMGAIKASASGESTTPGKTAGSMEFFYQWSFGGWDELVNS